MAKSQFNLHYIRTEPQVKEIIQIIKETAEIGLKNYKVFEATLDNITKEVNKFQIIGKQQAQNTTNLFGQTTNISSLVKNPFEKRTSDSNKAINFLNNDADKYRQGIYTDLIKFFQTTLKKNVLHKKEILQSSIQTCNDILDFIKGKTNELKVNSHDEFSGFINSYGEVLSASTVLKNLDDFYNGKIKGIKSYKTTMDELRNLTNQIEKNPKLSGAAGDRIQLLIETFAFKVNENLKDRIANSIIEQATSILGIKPITKYDDFDKIYKDVVEKADIKPFKILKIIKPKSDVNFSPEEIKKEFAQDEISTLYKYIEHFSKPKTPFFIFEASSKLLNAKEWNNDRANVKKIFKINYEAKTPIKFLLSDEQNENFSNLKVFLEQLNDSQRQVFFEELKNANQQKAAFLIKTQIGEKINSIELNDTNKNSAFINFMVNSEFKESDLTLLKDILKISNITQLNIEFDKNSKNIIAYLPSNKPEMITNAKSFLESYQNQKFLIEDEIKPHRSSSVDILVDKIPEAIMALHKINPTNITFRKVS